MNWQGGYNKEKIMRRCYGRIKCLFGTHSLVRVEVVVNGLDFKAWMCCKCGHLMVSKERMDEVFGEKRFC